MSDTAAQDASNLLDDAAPFFRCRGTWNVVASITHMHTHDLHLSKLTTHKQWKIEKCKKKTRTQDMRVKQWSTKTNNGEHNTNHKP